MRQVHIHQLQVTQTDNEELQARRSDNQSLAIFDRQQNQEWSKQVGITNQRYIIIWTIRTYS